MADDCQSYIGQWSWARQKNVAGVPPTARFGAKSGPVWAIHLIQAPAAPLPSMDGNCAEWHPHAYHRRLHHCHPHPHPDLLCLESWQLEQRWGANNKRGATSWPSVTHNPGRRWLNWAQIDILIGGQLLITKTIRQKYLHRILVCIVILIWGGEITTNISISIPFFPSFFCSHLRSEKTMIVAR